MVSKGLSNRTRFGARRSWNATLEYNLKTSRCVFLLAWSIFTPFSLASEPHRLRIEVTEPTGVQRDGSPIHTLLTLPHPVSKSTHFRLLYGGEPVVAQFRPKTNADESSQWWLDFVARSEPYETRDYVVEYGVDLQPGPERTRGHKLIEHAESFIVSNAPYIDWTVSKDLRGFLRSVEFTPHEHLRPDSIGLTIRDRKGEIHSLGGDGTTSRVLRQGKMAVALRFEKAETHEALRGVRWTVDLIFPGPVSWVELNLKLEDPEHRNLGSRLATSLELG